MNNSRITTGDRRWYRDEFYMPATITVDFVLGSFLVGVNERNGIVRIAADRTYKTLVECEGK